MKPLAIAAIAAAAGGVALALLFPRVDPSARMRLNMDRAAAITRARQIAARYGGDTTGWRAAVYNEASEKQRRYLETHQPDTLAKRINPVTTTVSLTDPSGKLTVRIALFPDGRLAEWRVIGPAPARGPAIDEILSDFAGADRLGFHGPVDSERDGVLHRTWTWSSAKLEIEQSNGIVLAARLAPVYEEAFEHEFAASRNSRLATAAYWIRSLACLPALIFCFWWIARRRIGYRIPLVLLLAQLAWAAVSFWGSTYQAQFLSFWHPGAGSNINVGPGFDRFDWSFWAALSFFNLFLFAATGSAVRVPRNREKWLTLDLVSRGKIWNRTVGRSAAVGLLAGIGVAAAPYVLAAVSKAEIGFHSIDVLVALFPAAVAIRLSAAVLAVEAFGFLLPLAGYLRRRWLQWLVFTPVGLVLTAVTTPFHSTAPMLVTAAVWFAAYAAIYLGADVLALATAMIGARAIVVPCLLLCQSAGSLRQSGLLLLVVGALAISASVHLAVRGREHDAEESAASSLPDLSEETQSARERLEAEFEVARKAQRDALPAAAPELEGYSIAGWCEPARQVGGDLYDYFALPDGRVCISVADVSGKGVPAALYMMVTKGLLAAVSRDCNDLPQILQQVNLHLYRACRRKVFVTMAAVVLDIRNRRLEYGRAGHNPMVWRRTQRRQTLLVKPQGLGLGMAPSEAFRRNLEVRELELDAEDTLVLYSDGVTEAVSESMEQFGEERLMRSIEAAAGLSADGTRDAILNDLARFVGSMPARDDITLVVVRVKGDQAKAA